MLGGLKLADPGVTTELQGRTEATSRLADISTTAAVPGRSAASGVCAASSHAAAARGDAAQAAFARTTSHYRAAIPDLRARGSVCRPLVWTANDWPHPAVTCSIQYAADIPACPQWATSVRKNSPPTQMETRDSNCPPSTKSSDDTGSPAKHITANIAELSQHVPQERTQA